MEPNSIWVIVGLGHFKMVMLSLIQTVHELMSQNISALHAVSRADSVSGRFLAQDTDLPENILTFKGNFEGHRLQKQPNHVKAPSEQTARCRALELPELQLSRIPDPGAGRVMCRMPFVGTKYADSLALSSRGGYAAGSTEFGLETWLRLPFTCLDRRGATVPFMTDGDCDCQIGGTPQLSMATASAVVGKKESAGMLSFNFECRELTSLSVLICYFI
ncbi:hypothetical protein BV22DRAFT_1123520 [Leucogyrophana mollusca]|uniref:Uncharacterized protein n=1 Tax=Leucogyrophana mollusca TaxID=85980 RepID=A0ACB8B1A4_9AGAM|nr:hypothetical protein BV22DRAFT_1123520 [Leucogyrophana mollusca]